MVFIDIQLFYRFREFFRDAATLFSYKFLAHFSIHLKVL